MLNLDVKQPVEVIDLGDHPKYRGIATCPLCHKDIHGMGQMERCPKCGQLLDWYNIIRK